MKFKINRLTQICSNQLLKENIMVKFPLYYSNNLSLTLNNGQGYCTDKANVLSSLPALCVGFLLISLGILEWLDLLKINNAPAINDITQSIIHSYTPVFSVYFFDFCFILLGILIVTTNLLNFFQYNKYFVIKQPKTIKLLVCDHYILLLINRILFNCSLFDSAFILNPHLLFAGKRKARISPGK